MNSIPYTNLQLNLYTNTQLDLFCSDNLSFLMHGFQYVTNQFDTRIPVHESQYTTYSPTWERCWLQSSSVHKMKITKLLGHKTLRCINTVASSSKKMN